jgi:hypothetical protein
MKSGLSPLWMQKLWRQILATLEYETSHYIIRFRFFHGSITFFCLCLPFSLCTHEKSFSDSHCLVTWTFRVTMQTTFMCVVLNWQITMGLWKLIRHILYWWVVAIGETQVYAYGVTLWSIKILLILLHLKWKVHHTFDSSCTLVQFVLNMYVYIKASKDTLKLSIIVLKCYLFLVFQIQCVLFNKIHPSGKGSLLFCIIHSAVCCCYNWPWTGRLQFQRKWSVQELYLHLHSLTLCVSRLISDASKLLHGLII